MFPADATGVFDNDNNGSLLVEFWLAGGSNFTSGTLQTTWASYVAANYAVGQTNLAAATSNYWQVTGVQLEAGPVATPFEFEPFETTLRKCQRYCIKTGGATYSAVGIGWAYGVSGVYAYITTPTEMRIVPTAVTYATLELSDLNTAYSISSVSIDATGSTNKLVALSVASSGLTTNRSYYLRAAGFATAYLILSAEL